MIWMKLVSQRELIEIFVGAKRAAAQPVTIHERHPAMHDELAALYWMEDPEKVRALPALVLVPKAAYRKVSAILAAAPGRPFPLSAVTRVVPVRSAPDLYRHSGEKRAALHGVAGLALADIAYAQSDKSADELSLWDLESSFAFVFGRILSTVDSQSFNEYVLVEKDVRDRLGDTRYALAASEKSQYEMLSVAYELATGEVSSKIGAVCHDLAVRRDVSDTTWLSLVSELGWKVPLSQIGRMNREDRLGCFYELNGMKHSLAHQVKDFSSALLASLISPGTFDHLDLVRGRGGRELVSWYCFVSSIQRDGSALYGKSGLGSRILRDMLASEDIFRPTSADVSSLELLQMESRDVARLWRLSPTRDALKVEVAPGLVLAYYRGASKLSQNLKEEGAQERQLNLLSSGHSVAPVGDGIEARLAEIARLLNEVVSSIPAQSSKPATKQKVTKSRSKAKTGNPGT